MFKPSTNPPQIFAQLHPAAPGNLPSALYVINANIHPIDREPDLLNALCCLKDANDIRGMVGLYDYFVAVAAAALNVTNRPRTTDAAADHLSRESDHALAKAYLVADFLKEMRPNNALDAELYAEVMFGCALAMGNTLSEAAAVVREISSWGLRGASSQGEQLDRPSEAPAC
jgi:hypothetical protein